MSNFQKDYWERKQLTKRRAPNHSVIQAYILPKIKEIQKNITINQHTTLLDVGAGNGPFSYWWNKICNTTAIDYSQPMINLNPIEKKYVMDVNQIEFPDNNFDITFCHSLLHHIDNLPQVLKEMRRVTKKYVITIEPNRNNPFMFLFSLIKREERLALKFSLKYLRQQIKKADLKIIAAFSCGLIVPNKCPIFLLPLLKLFNFKQPLGMFSIIIAKK